MTADVLPEPVTTPGVYLNMALATYHADPVPARSLSCSGAKKLLPPSCPALFAWERENPPPPKDVFDVGNAAHRLVLGAGPDIVVIPGERWDTAAAKAAVAEARAEGKTPVKASALEEITAMASAISAHPLASALLTDGQPEVSGFWIDEDAGIWRRARFDFLPNAGAGRRLIIPDYKTARSADPEEFAKSAADYGYHQQAAWYLDAAKALDLADDAAFVFIVQEKTAPYLVSVVQLDLPALRIGRYLNRQAIRTYAECEKAGRWPGYADDVALASLPYWYERRFEDQL